MGKVFLMIFVHILNKPRLTTPDNLIRHGAVRKTPKNLLRKRCLNGLSKNAFYTGIAFVRIPCAQQCIVVRITCTPWEKFHWNFLSKFCVFLNTCSKNPMVDPKSSISRQLRKRQQSFHLKRRDQVTLEKKVLLCNFFPAN